VITATVDINVFITGPLRDGPPRRCIEAAVETKYRLAISQPLLDELRNVLLRKKFSFAPAYIDIMIKEKGFLIIDPAEFLERLSE